MTVPVFFNPSGGSPAPTPWQRNLVLCYPHIPYSGSFLGSTSTGAGGSPRENSIMGERGKHFALASAGTAIQVDIDLGPTTVVQPDYALVARADLITKRDTGTVTFNLTGSASSSFTSPETVSQVITTASLMGPRGEDFLLPTSFSGGYRYWRCQVQTTASFAWEISKFYFGNFFDLGRDVAYPETIQRVATYKGSRDPRYTFTFNWEGITDGTIFGLQSTILKYRDVMPVFLYTRNYDYLLDGQKVVHAKIVDHQIKKAQYNTNSLALTFQEVL